MEDKGKNTEEKPPPSGEKETTSPKPMTTLTLLPGSSERPQQKPDSVNHGDLTATADQPASHVSEVKLGLDIDLNLEDKKLRRTISNRNSAQKSRARKLQYIHELEQKAEDLEVENLALRICVDSERKLKERLEMENSVLKRTLHFLEEKAKLSHALLELRQKMMRMQLGETRVSHQSIGVGTEEIVGSSSHEGGSATTEPMEEEQQGEIDPELNFKSITIDPPERLM